MKKSSPYFEHYSELNKISRIFFGNKYTYLQFLELENTTLFDVILQYFLEVHTRTNTLGVDGKSEWESVCMLEACVTVPSMFGGKI